MNRFLIQTSLVTCYCLLLCAPALAQRTQNDELSQLLFENYIKGPAKIDTLTVNSAIHLISERGRDNGFWEVVLEELQGGHEGSEIGCVRILGRMLATDAMARRIIERQNRTGEIGQWAANVALPAGVVDVLVERGKQADRFRVDHYVIALSRAEAPEATAFFRSILRDNRRNDLPGTQFHAAVGLAQLGEREGFEWLIANSENSTPIVGNAWPRDAQGNNLDTCCNAALQVLSGNREIHGRQAWETWLAASSMAERPKTAVRYLEP